MTGGACNTLEVLGRSGDEKITWDPEDADQVATARERFEEARAAGMSVFAVESVEVEQQGARLEEFDPTVGRMVAVPQLVGG